MDFKTDLWSVGVLAFEALTGERPFFAPTVGAVVLKIHRDPLPVPSAANPALPAAFDAWFAQACAREPERRFASAREMAASLARALVGEGAGAGAPSEPADGLPSVGERERLDGPKTAVALTAGSAARRLAASESSEGRPPLAGGRPAARAWLVGAMAAVAVGAAVTAAPFAGTARAIATPSHGPATSGSAEAVRAEEPSSSATAVPAQASGPSRAEADIRAMDAAVEAALARRAPAASKTQGPSPSARHPVTSAAAGTTSSSPAPPLPGDSDDDIK